MALGRVASALVFAAALAAGAWALLGLEVEQDITHFLPEAEDATLARIAAEVASSDQNRTVTLTVAAPDAAVAAAAVGALGARLAAHDGVAWVQDPSDDTFQRAFYELYFPRRTLFASDTPSSLAAELDDEGLRERARDLRRRLSLPTAPLVREIAPSDPWLLFPRHFERLERANQGGLVVRGGQLVTADGRHGVLVFATRASPFETQAQRGLEAAIAEAFAEVNEAHGGVLELEQSGVARIALASEAAIKGDVSRVGTAGVLGVVFFLLLLFRSPRLLVLGHVPLVVGFAAALVTSRLVFGTLHGLTLAFGATLIGVAIDYVAHYLNHQVLAPSSDGPEGTMRRIWPGLWLGALTTIVGLGGLAGTSFPAIREMAVFTCVGVLAALLSTRFLLPPFMPVAPTATGLHRRLGEVTASALVRLRGSRLTLALLPLLALGLLAAGLSRLTWQDDIRVLGGLDGDLLAEDERVRERVARMDAGRFVVSFGADLEEALDRNDRVHHVLAEAIEAGELAQQRSLHDLLWSARLQRENHAALADFDAWQRTARAFAAEGFVEDAFAPFRDVLGADAPEPLTRVDLEGTPVERLVAPFVLELGDEDATRGVAVLTFVQGVTAAQALAARLDEVGATLFDQQAYLESAYGRFRTTTLEVVGLGLLVVFLLVAVRYRRRPARALAAFMPAVLAAAAAFGVAALVGELHLMHVVALLLVSSMGVDYGVFVVESEQHPEGIGPTVVSLLVACASTVLSFGTLAMSDNPALEALGLTVAVGVLMSLLLAPAAALLLRSG